MWADDGELSGGDGHHRMARATAVVVRRRGRARQGTKGWDKTRPEPYVFMRANLSQRRSKSLIGNRTESPSLSHMDKINSGCRFDLGVAIVVQRISVAALQTKSFRRKHP